MFLGNRYASEYASRELRSLTLVALDLLSMRVHLIQRAHVARAANRIESGLQVGSILKLDAQIYSPEIQMFNTRRRRRQASSKMRLSKSADIDDQSASESVNRQTSQPD